MKHICAYYWHNSVQSYVCVYSSCCSFLDLSRTNAAILGNICIEEGAKNLGGLAWIDGWRKIIFTEVTHSSIMLVPKHFGWGHTIRRQHTPPPLASMWALTGAQVWWCHCLFGKLVRPNASTPNPERVAWPLSWKIILLHSQIAICSSSAHVFLDFSRFFFLWMSYTPFHMIYASARQIIGKVGLLLSDVMPYNCIHVWLLLPSQFYSMWSSLQAVVL